MATALETNTTEQDWVKFCERHAVVAAQDFAKSCYQYIHRTLPETARSTVTHKDFLRRFVECFTETFDKDYARRRLQLTKVSNGSSPLEDVNEIVSDNEEGSPKMPHKHFLRRLSFKMLRKGREIFAKQHSDDSESKTKLAKIVVECRKEGFVNYTTPECLDQAGSPPKWEKCRLALIKAVGGYMLEFYSPPKSTKPKSGVFCALIVEARETTALEMPDHENTFVLKADNNIEYVIEAPSTDEMRSWLATIRYCMRSMQGHDLAGAGEFALKDGHHQSGDPPEVPPRHLTSGQRNSFGSNSEFSPQSETNGTVESDIGQLLKKELWFHGTLGRSEAAQLVLHEGPANHGLFLVRQSETRTGEFVLTFNFRGRAKHLRMTINELGQCRVQHFWFQSIYEMLEHFRRQPIPLESGGNSDVTLTDYVVNPGARAQLQGSLPRTVGQTTIQQSQGGQERRPPPLPEQRNVQTHNGSVRTQEITLEQVTEATNRAVENQYSFV
nr:SH2B adapter protein 1 [Onthophagus taurus]